MKRKGLSPLCQEAATGTLCTRRLVPTGVCTVQAAPSVQTPVRTGSPVYKVRSPLRAWSCTETAAKPRWAGYGNRRKVRTTGGPCDQKACTACRRPIRPGSPQWPADSELVGRPGRLRPSRRTHAKCRSPLSHTSYLRMCPTRLIANRRPIDSAYADFGPYFSLKAVTPSP